MTSEEPPISDRTWLRVWLDSEFRNIRADFKKLREDNERDHQELKAQFEGLESKVDTALTAAAMLQAWQDRHDKHHGSNDVEIARRIDGIAGEKHDSEVSNAAVAAYKERWRWLGEVATDARKVITVGIASSLLVAVGYIVGHI